MRFPSTRAAALFASAALFGCNVIDIDITQGDDEGDDSGVSHSTAGWDSATVTTAYPGWTDGHVTTTPYDGTTLWVPETSAGPCETGGSPETGTSSGYTSSAETGFDPSGSTAGASDTVEGQETATEGPYTTSGGTSGGTYDGTTAAEDTWNGGTAGDE